MNSEKHVEFRISQANFKITLQNSRLVDEPNIGLSSKFGFLILSVAQKQYKKPKNEQRRWPLCVQKTTPLGDVASEQLI